jgi:hypothetical protein
MPALPSPISDQPLALSPVELAAGIDALYLSGQGEVPTVLLDELDALKDGSPRDRAAGRRDARRLPRSRSRHRLGQVPVLVPA